MEGWIDDISRDLAHGLSRRSALVLLGKAFASSVLLSLGVRKADAASCFADCKAKCTAPDGTLDFVCFRNCVNSDPNNCGSCGNKCPPGFTCVNGKCTGGPGCSTDAPTIDSLDAAKSALAAGANKVALSPKGCYQLTRSTVGPSETQQILFDGTAIMSFQNTSTQLMGRINSNSGSQLLWNLERGATPDNFTRQLSYFTPSTGVIFLRETVVSSAGSIHTTVEEQQSGSLVVVSQYDPAVEDFYRQFGDQLGTTKLTAAQNQERISAISFTGCDAAQQAQLTTNFRHAVDVGLECFKHYKATDTILDLMFNYVARDAVLVCDSTLPPNVAARSDPTGVFDPEAPVTIRVNNPSFFTLDDRDQASVIFHELLHYQFGSHNSLFRGYARREELDRIEACQSLCFGESDSTGPDQISSPPTKCSCATCLRTDVCDPRCSLEPDCDPNLAFICPCPTGPNMFRPFTTCTNCLVTCPSGLGCFGFASCWVIGVSCTASTCP